MNPLNFYKNPNELDYEKDIDEVGRDLIKQINQTDYLRTTMYCSGHFKDEQKYPWKKGEMTLCLLALDVTMAYIKLQTCVEALRNEFKVFNIGGGDLYLYLDKDDNNKAYYLAELLVNYKTKEERQRVVEILKQILI
jgi:hypothetical protein